MGKMSDKEKQQWKELLLYVEKEIFDYDENQHLQKDAVLRLRGILNGKVYANNNTDDNGNYGIDVLLNTFKINRVQILNAIQNKDFTNEGMKMAYISAIVRSDINDVYDRMKRAEKSKNDAKKVDTTAIQHKRTKYVRRTVDVNDSKFEELW